ncbi:MAG: VTT domain-containing protein, partial [Candidatus Bathyarchaeota archaeon]
MLENLRELFMFLIANYSYFGLFLVQVISSASILIPVPGYIAILVAGARLNPLGIAISSGLGSAVGEFTGYMLGVGGMKLAGDRFEQVGDRFEQIKAYRSEIEAATKIFTQYQSGAIFLFAATALPFDLAGILCGTLGIDPSTFFVATLAGKTTKFLLIAYTGKNLFEVFQSLLEGTFDFSSLFLVALLTLLMVGPLFYWRRLVERLRNLRPDTEKE